MIWSTLENEELVKLYESGRVGQHIPQGSIKSFRQYADYMTLSSIPIWPITPVKVSFFLLFRLLMGDVTNGTPLRNAYVRSLARSLEHYREETARYFIGRWPEAGSWIIRDGRGDPDSRNDITHDILRICKLGQHRRIDTLIDLKVVQSLVTGNNSALRPDAWATRRRLSARWVRDRDSANLPERQYTGGKFIGLPPKPPPLSARSTHWNRHLHDLRGQREEGEWRQSIVGVCSGSPGGGSTDRRQSPLISFTSPSYNGEVDESNSSRGEDEEEVDEEDETEVETGGGGSRSGGSSVVSSSSPAGGFSLAESLAYNNHRPVPSSLGRFGGCSGAEWAAGYSLVRPTLGLPPIAGADRITHPATVVDPSFENGAHGVVLPSLFELGLHPSTFPLVPPCPSSAVHHDRQLLHDDRMLIDSTCDRRFRSESTRDRLRVMIVPTEAVLPNLPLLDRSEAENAIIPTPVWQISSRRID